MMMLAEATATWIPGTDGLVQLGMIAAAGVAVFILLGGEKAKEGEPAKATWLSRLKLPSLGSSVASEKPTVGEADELFRRLLLLSDELVDDYADGLDLAWKHLTWRKDKPKTEGPTVAAP